MVVYGTVSGGVLEHWYASFQGALWHHKRIRCRKLVFKLTFLRHRDYIWRATAEAAGACRPPDEAGLVSDIRPWVWAVAGAFAVKFRENQLHPKATGVTLSRQDQLAGATRGEKPGWVCSLGGIAAHGNGGMPTPPKVARPPRLSPAVPPQIQLVVPRTPSLPVSVWCMGGSF